MSRLITTCPVLVSDNPMVVTLNLNNLLIIGLVLVLLGIGLVGLSYRGRRK